MTHSEQATSAKKKLLARHVALSRSRVVNDADTIELNAEKRGEELAENVEISDVLVLLSQKESAALKEVDAALERIDRGSWGRCESCHEAISPRRLTALPEARTCERCAT